MRWDRSNAGGRLFVDAILFLAFMGMILVFLDKDCEDAFICYRVAKNFVCGGGLVYTPGERIEGISNLGWTLLLAGMYRAGFDPLWSGRFLVVIFSALFFWMLRKVSLTLFGPERWRSRIPLLATIGATYVTASAGTTLEGPAVSFFLALLLFGMCGRRWGLMALAATAGMTLRPEGILAAVLAGVWLVFEAWRKRFPWGAVWRYMAFTECALLGVSLFRFFYYGDILPNTLRAKSPATAGEGLWRLLPHLEYPLAYVHYLGPLFLMCCVLGLFHKSLRSIVAVCWLLALSNIAVGGVGGDWMPAFRLYTPYFFFLAVAATAGVAVFERGRARVRYGASLALILGLGMMFVPAEFGAAWKVFSPSALLPKCAPRPLTSHPDRSIAPHLSSGDLSWPDDLFAIGLGGRNGWLLDGVPGIEAWGLTDRTHCSAWTDTQVHVIGGIRNWRSLFERNLTGIVFVSDMDFCIFDMLKVRGSAGFLRDFVAIRGGYNYIPEFLLRGDREAATLFLYDYSDFCPATDYPMFSTETLGNVLPWQHIPWRDGEATYAPSCLEWGEVHRVSVAVPCDAGRKTLRKALPDNAPLVLLLGLPGGASFDGRVLVQNESNGDDRCLATLNFSVEDSDTFATMGVAIPSGAIGSSGTLALTIETGMPGTLYLGVYRWSGSTGPILPSEFTHTRLNHAVRYANRHGSTDDTAVARANLDAFKRSDAGTVENRLRSKREVFKGAYMQRCVLRNHPESASAREAMDAYYDTVNDPEAHALEWRSLAERLPDRSAPWFHLLLAALKNGDGDTFVQAADRLTQTTRGDSPLRVRAAAAMMAYGPRADRARRPIPGPALRGLFDDLLPDDKAICLGLAHVVDAFGDSASAIEYTERIAARYPGFERAFTQLAAYYSAHLRDEEAVARWRFLLEQHPDSAFVWLHLGNVYERLQQYPAAADALSHVRAAGLENRAVSDLSTHVAERMTVASRELFASGRPEEALAESYTATVLVPSSFEACKNAAALYASVNQMDTARLLYRSFIAGNDVNYSGFEALSDAYVASGDLDGLLDEWRRFTEENPGAHLGWFCLGLARERRHDYSEALDAYRRGLALEPSAVGTRDAIARVTAILNK